MEVQDIHFQSNQNPHSVYLNQGNQGAQNYDKLRPVRISDEEPSGYKRRQQGCMWILYFLGGLTQLIPPILHLTLDSSIEDGNIIYGICLMVMAFGIIWTQVEDKGDHLLVIYGPWRWAIFGMGKEKIRYENIKHYAITKACGYGHGIAGCSGLKLFSTCSCCCGHQVVRLSIDETFQGLGASDDTDCCLERCCLRTFLDQNAEWCGYGACCKCCNPCRMNCSAFNTVHISTNDAEGLLQLLEAKCGRDGERTVVI